MGLTSLWSDAYPARYAFPNPVSTADSDRIYDACMKVGSDPRRDGTPCNGSWLIDLTWSRYKAKVVDDDPASNTPFPFDVVVGEVE